MSYPFSGILVRYLPLTEDGCRCETQSSANQNQSEALHHEGDAVALPSAKSPADAPLDIKKDVHLGKPLDELHVNVWEIGKNSSDPFMDIGVMIGERDKVGHLVVDLPWTVEQKDISDLGARLNGEKSVAAIFNEIVHYDGFAEGNFANISFRKNDVDVKPFSLLRLNSQYFKIINMYLGDGVPASRLIIKIPPIPDSVAVKDRRKSAYVRFRIRKIPSQVYTEVFYQKDRAIISSTIATRIVDFRINVRRGIPEALLSGDEKIYFPEFSKIHCFLTTERTEQCISQSHSYAGYRSLMDEDVWNEYVRLDTAKGISAENSVKNYLGYQWTASATKNEDGSIKSVKDLIVLGRFSKVKSDLFSVITFIFLVICFGALGSGCWDYVKEFTPDHTHPVRIFGLFGAAILIILLGYLFPKFYVYLKKLKG